MTFQRCEDYLPEAKTKARPLWEQTLLWMKVIPVGKEGPQRAEPHTGIPVSESPLGEQLPGELPDPTGL